MKKNIKKNKSIIIIYAALLLTSSIAIESINSQQNDTTLSIQDIIIQPNGVKRAEILIYNIENLGAFNITISYDLAILNIEDIENDIEKCGIENIFSYQNSTNKFLNIGGYDIGGITTNSICIAKIKFKAVGSDGESCDLVIEESKLFTAEHPYTEIPHETVNGKATIKADSSGDGGGDGGGGGGGVNTPPVADASDSETTGFVNTPINFDGSASSDSDGTITNFSWDFGDGKTGYGSTTTHIYTKTGTFSVTLRVTDNGGLTDDDTFQVVISQPNIPPSSPDINGPQVGKQNVVFDYTAVSTDGDNDSIQYIFNWGDDTSITTDFVENGTVVTESHSWSMWGVYTIMVKAYDNMSESGTTSYDVLIDVIWVKDIGYLIDTDSDGVIYEKFFSNETESQTDPTKLENGSYMINSDADDDDDWIYDPQTDTLTPYTAPSKPMEEQDNTYLYAFILIVIIILIIIGAAIGRKPKPSKKSKSKEK